MSNLVITLMALGLSAAASSSGLLTTIRVLLPDLPRSLPWWYAAGNCVGFTTCVLGLAALLRLLAYQGGPVSGQRSRGVELALGLALLLIAAALLRIEAAAGALRRLMHRYGRVGITKAWTPSRLFFQGARLTMRPRGLILSATAGLLLERNDVYIGWGIVGGLAYGAASTIAIVLLTAVLQRHPTSSRLLIVRARVWVGNNAPQLASAVAAITGLAVAAHAIAR